MNNKKNKKYYNIRDAKNAQKIHGNSIVLLILFKFLFFLKCLLYELK